MADDWDLQAVVRGCTTNSASSCSSSSNSSTTSTTFNFISSTSTTTCGGENSIMFPQQDESLPLIQDLYDRNDCGSQDLHDLYRPFFPKPSSPLSPQSIIPISSLSVLGLQDLSQQIHRHNHHHHHHHHHQQQQHQQMLKPKQNLSMVGPYRSKTSNASPQPQNSRSKRRKNQMKRVIEIPAEALSSDMWSWRKYGQKPIKGSPYPRGYYRCSTSKGCLARKQVERNRSDPGMFIVTYTAEHNHPMPTHRNSLAGSSRQKPTTSGDPNRPSGSPLASSDSISPEYEKLDIESCKDEMIEDDEDENTSNSPSCMNLEDDFFDGLDELVGIAPPPAPAAAISNTFSQNTQFPWFTNNATTTAAGGV